MLLAHLAYRIKFLSLYPPGWRALERATKRAHPWCSFCGQREDKKRGIILQVHHQVPVHIDPTRVLDPTNLIVLCPWDHLHEGHVSDFQRGHDPDIAARSDSNLKAIRIVQLAEGI